MENAGESHGGSFSALIRDTRKRLDLSQEELAGESHVARSTIARWEKGEHGTSLDPQQVGAVCDVLGIPREEAFRALGWLQGTGYSERPFDYLRAGVISDVKDRREQLRLLRRIDERERTALAELEDDIRRAKGA